ncbi:hypothetical protein B0H11DRAFT_2278394 [Mycena galericulata]|nr:hypothetical protein B0H11DRAFT_2278394 [Mycena galericulata]
MSDAETIDDPTELENKCFFERRDSGFYDSVLDQMKAMPNALANLEYIGTKKRGPDIFKGEDWTKNIVFKDGPGQNASEYRAAIFGEIAEPCHGTLVRAQGNHYDGRDGEPFKPVDDKSKIKDVLVLRAPSYCSLELQNLYDNQTALIQDIENTENAIDTAKGWTPNFRSSLKSSRPDFPTKDLITTLTQKKYAARGPKVNPPVGRVERVKRKFGNEDDDDERDSSPESPASVDRASKSSKGKVKYPADNEVKLGAFYDPHVLEDYGGEYFQHVNAKLQQLDIRDADNKLIPPWKQYAALRPGSLVLVLVTIHIYTFKDQGSDRDRDRKLVQLNAHTIRVLDESDFPVEVRTRPVPRTLLDGPSTPKKSAGGFNDFVVTPRSSPSKTASGSAAGSAMQVDDAEGPAGKRRKGGRK